MKSLLTTMLALCWIVAACQNKGFEASQDSPENPVLKGADRPSEDNGGLPGYTLQCDQTIISDIESTFACNLMANQETIDLGTELINWEASIERPENSVFSTVAEDRISFKLSRESNTPSTDDLLNTHTLIFEGMHKDAGSFKVITKLSDSIQGSEPAVFPFYKIEIESIETSFFVETTACIRYLEASDGLGWLPNGFDGADYTIGDYRVSLNAEIHQEFVNDILTDDGLFWESELQSYQAQAPFNSVMDSNWVSLSFDQAVSLSGIRIKADIETYPVGECIPDQISVFASSDGVSWQRISQASFETPSSAGPWVTMVWR